jgi:uncharacterized protein
VKRWAGWAALGAAAAAAGGGAAMLWYATRIERKSVSFDRFTLYVDKPGLPPAGLTILHLSDFHCRAGDAVQAEKAKRLLALLDRESYDVVALTGDLIHDWAGLPAALDLVASLRPTRAAFYCPGNHDYAEYSVWGMLGDSPAGLRQPGGRRALAQAADTAQAVLAFIRKVATNELVRLPVAFNDMPALYAKLASCGVEPLVNRAMRLRVGSADVWFAGVDDALEGRPDFDAALADVPAGATLVLLAHNPDAWLDGRVARADLVLSGHTHGGQVRVPGIGAAHTQGTHLSRRQAAGWFQRGTTSMFVTRGLGESIPLRFGAGPQAALIQLLPRRLQIED